MCLYEFLRTDLAAIAAINYENGVDSLALKGGYSNCTAFTGEIFRLMIHAGTTSTSMQAAKTPRFSSSTSQIWNLIGT